MKAYLDTVPGSCGLGVVYDYSDTDYYGGKDHIDCLQLEDHGGGTGFNIAAFIENQACSAAYKEIVKNYPIVYQSPVRLNSNSENDFFFVIFDKEIQLDVSYITPVWPW